MTILAVASEDSDFEKLGLVASTTIGSMFRSNYVRYALNIDYGGGDPLSRGLYFKFPTAISEFWLTARLYMGDPVSNNQSPGTSFLSFRLAGVERLRIAPTSDGTKMVHGLFKVDAAGNVTQLALGTVQVIYNLIKLDAYVKYAVAGSVKLYANGIPIFSYDGDITTDAATTLDQARLADWGRQTCSWSEVILADEDTRNFSLARLTPLADGPTQDWSGTVGDINESTLNDSSAISTPDPDKLALFTTTPAAVVTGNVGIRSVHVNTRSAKGSTGPQNLKASVRVGATTYDSASKSVSTLLGSVNYTFAQNPATSAAWTAADLTAVGSCIGVKSAA